jgi:Domain of unknown function (DUF3560)
MSSSLEMPRYTRCCSLRGPGRAAITTGRLQANRFRYSRNLGQWYLPHSRDKSANTGLIEHTAATLREAGHSVETTIDNDAIPMGQPILAGHHAEKWDRSYRDRAFGNRDKSFREADKATYRSIRSEVAGSYRKRRENIGTTLRRIEKLEADERFWANTLTTGYNSSGWTTKTPESVGEINRRLAAVREELEHWRGKIRDAEQSGVKIWTKEGFRPGD